MTPEEVHTAAMAAGLTHEQAITATAIAWAESGLKAAAIGDEGLQDQTWGPSCGLWQIRSLRADTGTGRTRDRDRLLDPAFNARSMFAISAKGTDWNPWSVYRDGKYRQYLDRVRAAVEGRTAMARIENGPVVAHAQAFADEAAQRFGTVFKTYNGHQPTRERALDCWDTDADLDALAEWAKQNAKRFGVDYVIWWQRIWNPEVSPNWRQMEDRGSATNNHKDHVHVSFEATAPAVPDPKPPEEDDDMRLYDFEDDDGHTRTYITNGVASEHVKGPHDRKVLEDGGIRWLKRPSKVQHHAWLANARSK